MDTHSVKSVSGSIDDEYYSSDEYNYDDDEAIDSDDYEQQSTMATRSKRLKTPAHDVSGQFRKTTSSTSSTGGDIRTSSGKIIERMPTRRPNPKISNRNAVMARENRRKKKEYLENLQRDVDQFQSENKKLRKLLNMRNTTITKLTNESLYLKSVLANKTEIMALLKSIQGSRVPITSSNMSFMTDDVPKVSAFKREPIASYATSSSGCSPASSFSPSPQYHLTEQRDDEKENGTNWVDGHDPFLSAATILPPTSTINHTDFSFTDLDNHFSLDTDGLSWENLLMNNGGMRQQPYCIADLRDIDDSEILSTNGSHNVNHEHNYFNNPVKPTKGMHQPTMATDTTAAIAPSAMHIADDSLMDMATSASTMAPGVCLHVAGGRVSLEFCASCHHNSQNAWIEE